MPRLFVVPDITFHTTLVLDRAQANYLRAVMRIADGGEVLIFNGRDGEWRARLDHEGRKGASLTAIERTREQTPPGDLHYFFAPLKQGRLDYMVQKAVEMGASHIRPVLTEYTQVRRLNLDRLEANITEAAEQCGVLARPVLSEPFELPLLLAAWDRERRLIFCDEGAETQNALDGIAPGPLAVLIGPEGGFSPMERQMLLAKPFVTPMPLGPRILRADTAAVAALAVVQSVLGDWS